MLYQINFVEDAKTSFFTSWNGFSLAWFEGYILGFMATRSWTGGIRHRLRCAGIEYVSLTACYRLALIDVGRCGCSI